MERALWPIGRGDRKFWISVTVLSALVLFGLYAYVYQLQNGLWVTGLNQKVSWGFYIINCVFFIGISYGGAMTSAILRLTNAKWRAPLTRRDQPGNDHLHRRQAIGGAAVAQLAEIVPAPGPHAAVTLQRQAVDAAGGDRDDFGRGRKGRRRREAKHACAERGGEDGQ